MTPAIIYPALVLVGLIVGHGATNPPDLRRLRPFQTLLLPAMLCAIYTPWSNLAPPLSHGALRALLVLAASLSLFLTLAPNLIWLFRSLSQETVGRQYGPYLDEERHLAPIRRLVEADNYEAACQRLEAQLRTHRADFPALLLMAQLYHHLKKNKKAERCLLVMIRTAPGDEEQLATMRLYHQLANG
jgi:hypothetical protein